MKIFIIFLMFLQLGCSLQAQLESMFEPVPIEFTEKNVISNGSTSVSTLISGTCAKGISSFVILEPAPAQTVLCQNGRWSATVDVSGSPDGAVEIKTDQYIPRSMQQISFVVKKDTEPPTLSSLILESGASLTNKSVISYLVVGGEIAKIYLTEDSTCASGGSWQATSGSVNVSHGDGMKGFYIKAQDLAGNVTGCILGSSIYLDQTPPVITGLADDLIVKGSTSWNWACSDANGPCEYRHHISSTMAFDPVGAYNLTQSATKAGDGVFFINVQARDAAGNESAVRAVQVLLSSNLPGLTIENGALYHNSNAALLHLSNFGGFDEVELSYTVDCAAATAVPVAATLPWNLTAGDGLKTVYYRFRNVTTANMTACQSASITVDTAAPTLLLSSAVANPFNAANFTVTAAFSEAVMGFSLGDIVVANGVASGLSGSGSSYTFVVTPTNEGTVTVSVGSSVALDVTSNGNSAATDLTRVWDTTSPTLTLSSGAASLFNTATFSVTATFSEAVSDFALGDIVVTNGVASALSGSGAVYTFTVTPSSQGQVTVAVGAAVVVDGAGNPNTAAADLIRSYDSVAPTISGLSDDATWVKTKTWTWGCSEFCDYRFVVDTVSNTVPSGAFSSLNTATQGSGTGTYYLHVQAQDLTGNVSTLHVLAKLDNTAPIAPTGVVDQTALASLSSSPAISFTSGSDAHSGLDKHQARVLRVSDSAVISSWANITSGASIAGLGLTTNTSYKMEVVALDALGNTSSSAFSDGWIADTSAPTAPTGLAAGAVPASGSASPVLTWSASSDGAGGSGVLYYQAQIFRVSDNGAISSWTTLGSGGNVTGLTLTDGAQYYFKTRAIDAVGNISTESAASAAWTANSNPCSGTPAAGTVCPGGAVFVGSFNGYRYMTTPGNCTDSATPTCDNGPDSLSKSFGTLGTLTNRVSTTDGTGNSSFLAANYADTYAAKYCENMSYGGYTDWFLPAKDELNLMGQNRTSLGGLGASPYFSSTESSVFGTPSTDVWVVRMDNGTESSGYKGLVGALTRCMRKY